MLQGSRFAEDPVVGEQELEKVKAPAPTTFHLVHGSLVKERSSFEGSKAPTPTYCVLWCSATPQHTSWARWAASWAASLFQELRRCAAVLQHQVCGRLTSFAPAVPVREVDAGATPLQACGHRPAGAPACSIERFTTLPFWCRASTPRRSWTSSACGAATPASWCLRTVRCPQRTSWGRWTKESMCELLDGKGLGNVLRHNGPASQQGREADAFVTHVWAASQRSFRCTVCSSGAQPVQRLWKACMPCVCERIAPLGGLAMTSGSACWLPPSLCWRLQADEWAGL